MIITMMMMSLRTFRSLVDYDDDDDDDDNNNDDDDEPAYLSLTGPPAPL